MASRGAGFGCNRCVTVPFISTVSGLCGLLWVAVLVVADVSDHVETVALRNLSVYENSM